VSAVNRNQWSSISKAFSTIGVSGDIATSKDINFGVDILQLTAGDAGFRYLNGQASISYSGIHLGKEGLKTISFGLQGGLLNRRFDFSKLQSGSQFKPFEGYDNSVSVGESFGKPSATTLDLGAGLAYYDGDVDKMVNIFGGIAASHINQPKDAFFSSSSDTKIPIRYTIHGGARIIVSENASLVPNAVFIKQSSSTEIMVGGYGQMAINEQMDIMAGLNYRYQDAVYPYIGLNLDKFIIGLSYDVNTSKLGKAAKAPSSYELSFMYSNRKGTDKGYFKCPRF